MMSYLIKNGKCVAKTKKRYSSTEAGIARYDFTFHYFNKRFFDVEISNDETWENEEVGAIPMASCTYRNMCYLAFEIH